MQPQQAGNVELLTFELFGDHDLLSFATTKDSANLKFGIGDTESTVLENRRKLVAALEIDLNQLVTAEQTHGDGIAVVAPGTRSEQAGVDALITNTPGKCLMVLVADCVPVILFDPAKKVLGVVHAGWKGTAAQIAAKTVAAMQHRYGADPAVMLAGLGPSICVKHYPVKPELASQFAKQFPHQADSFIIRPGGKPHLDLPEVNRRQLIAAGLDEANIELAGLCTYEDVDRFYSARRDHSQTGRIALGAMLRMKA